MMSWLATRMATAVAAPWLLLVSTMASCAQDHSPPPLPRVEVLLDADTASMSASNHLSVKVWDTDGAEVFLQSVEIGEDTFPARVRLLPLGDDPTRRFRVEAQLVDEGGTTIAWQRALGSYVDGRAVEVALRFTGACTNVECRAHETCVDGSCVPACLQMSVESTGPLSPPGVCQVYVDGREPARAVVADDPIACLEAESPCASLQYALESYVTTGGGTEINIHGGAEYDSVHLQARHSGSEARRTVLRAWPETGMPLFDAQDMEPQPFRFCCDDDSASYVVLDGLEITGGIANGVEIAGNGAHHNEVRGCLIHHSSRGPSSTGHGGVVLWTGAEDNLIVGNTIRDNVHATPGSSQGINIRAAANNQLIDNVITGNAAHGIALHGSANTVIRGNRIENNGARGITAFNSGIPLIEHNIVCSNMDDGIKLNRSANARIEHNTVVSNADGIDVCCDDSEDAVIRNNIVAFNRSRGIEVEAPTPTDDHNLVHENASGDFAGFTPAGRVIMGDPDFVDLGTCDLSLGSESAALGEAQDGGDLGARLE